MELCKDKTGQEYPSSQTKSVTHTPTPWVTGLYDASLDFVKIGVHVAVCRPDLSLLATCGPAGDKQSEADAAFIVRAVNAHAELLRVCKLIYEVENEGDDFCPDWMRELREAIAKAEKK